MIASLVSVVFAAKKIHNRDEIIKNDLATENELIQRQLLEDFLENKNYN